MKQKLLFLAKLALISAAGFYLWKSFVSKPYGLFLSGSVWLIRPFFIKSDANLLILDKVPYFYLVFLSLVLATPYTPILRRIKLFLGGTLIFFTFDFLTVFLGVTSILGQPNYFLHTPALYVSAVYSTSLTILPIALWLVPNLPKLGSLFEKPSPMSQASPHLKPIRICPVCKKEKYGLLDHIRSVHGEKSLRSWKVRRFLAKRSLT